MASVHACEDIMRTYPLDLLVDVEAVEVASDCGSFSRDIAPKVNLLEELVSAPDQKKKEKKVSLLLACLLAYSYECVYLPLLQGIPILCVKLFCAFMLRHSGVFERSCRWMEKKMTSCTIAGGGVWRVHRPLGLLEGGRRADKAGILRGSRALSRSSAGLAMRARRERRIIGEERTTRRVMTAARRGRRRRRRRRVWRVVQALVEN